MTMAEHDDSQLQRPAAEKLYADELAKLAEHDSERPRPAGWKLSPEAICDFVLGNDALGITPKFVGSRRFVERCIVALATQRGLMLIGEPGTAKSYLSELLAAAVSADSTLTVQGSAGTTEDDIKYSWNYALLMSEGPTERALVPSPLYTGMQRGGIVRFEEITRCPLEIQDTLLSILSDRVMLIPEFDGDARTLFARNGFNVIATANTRDRGVNEMSAALKRRFNFETVHPIASLDVERELVRRETDHMLDRAGIPLRLDADVTEILVTTFHELREGKTLGGKSIESVSTVMSTAEAVAVAFASTAHAHYFGSKKVSPSHIFHNLVGSALKEDPEDLKRLRHYFERVVRARKGKAWEGFYRASLEIGGDTDDG
jgi:MoxR-like ATPase